jgi:predicted DNA-binding transcriptional regulator AlpA
MNKTEPETITFREIIDLCGASESWVYARIKSGSLPKPLFRGARSTKGNPGFKTQWDRDEIIEWDQRLLHLGKMRRARAKAKYGLVKERAGAAALLERLGKELSIYDFEQSCRAPRPDGRIY